MKVTTAFGVAMLAGALASAGYAQTFNQIYIQSFDTAGSSTDFLAPLTAGGTSAADFGFDYSTLVVPAGAGAPLGGAGVPEAPNTPTGATATRGLVTSANTGTAAQSVINVFTNAQYSGDYEAQVDVFYYHDGGGGSTEDVLFGVNHSGTLPIAIYTTGTPFSGTTDGYFYKHFADADVGGSDHFFLEGAASPINRTSQVGTTWADALTPDNPGRDAADPLVAGALPAVGAAAAGQARWKWSTVRIRVLNGVASLYLNDTLIVSYDDPDDTFTAGRILLGHSDSFSGVNANNRMIFDNLIVREYVAPTATPSPTPTPVPLSARQWNLHE